MNSNDIDSRLSKLEILVSEQDYTVETLNAVVTRQALDIDQLSTQLELLKHQIKELKNQMPETSIIDDKPPHY